jgi:hypothetical protein
LLSKLRLFKIPNSRFLTGFVQNVIAIEIANVCGKTVFQHIGIIFPKWSKKNSTSILFRCAVLTILKSKNDFSAFCDDQFY